MPVLATRFPIKRIGQASFVALCAVGLLAAQSPPSIDAPYVVRVLNEWRARTWAGDGTLDTVAGAKRVRVAAVGDVPSFDVDLRPAVTAAEAGQAELGAANSLFVLADSHGEYEIAVELLRNQGIIGRDLRWRFGSGRLVILGDIFDRGAHQTELLWLFYKLEAEARRTGGAVHVLLGNHESMTLRGDLRYLHPKYADVAKTLGADDYSKLFKSDSLLGAWLRSKATILKLDDMLFLHGGVSPKLAESGLSIDRVNDIHRAVLDIPSEHKNVLDKEQALVAGPDGPMWYRGYFSRAGRPAEASLQQVTASLQGFSSARVFVGHTKVDRVQSLFDGRVIAVQVYPTRDKTTGIATMEGVYRLKGTWYRGTADGKRTKL